MFKSLIAFSSLCAIVGLWIGVTSNERMVGRELQLIGGRTVFSFSSKSLRERELRVDVGQGTKAKNCAGAIPAFRIEKSDLRFRLAGGRFLAFDGGQISHEGGFKLVTGGKTIFANDFTIKPNANRDGLSVMTGKGKDAFAAFDLVSPKGLRKSETDQVILQSMDLLISESCAEKLGNSKLAGEKLGSVSLYCESLPADGGGDVDIPESSEIESDSVGLDVSLFSMSSLGVASNPTGRVGNRNGLTMTTTSCNVGTVNIQWFAPMQTAHPVIAMNLYRLRNGRFEQVGWSWLKHGFLSTNSNGCGTCQNPGTGSLLGVNCSDTYGNGNNSDRTYLGGRDEVNAFSGQWTCQNSWFSNYVNDCVRRNPGTASIDAVDHRLEVIDEDLGNAGAQYFYEAYYITGGGDINTYNNIGSRQATMTFSGGAWSFTTTTAMLQGPAIQRWGELRTTAAPQSEGDVIVAVQTTDNGNGTWHYEFALYNHNLDRQVREFSVPVPASATLTNIEFRDIDKNATNEWTSAFSNGLLKWSTGTFGTSGANPLKYSSIFNFRFDANVPPASTMTTLGLFKPGSGTELTAPSRGPLVLSDVASVQVTNGVLQSGNQQSLDESDNNRMVISPTSNGQRMGTGVTVSIFAPVGTINSFVLGIESSNTLVTGGGTQTTQLWDWTTSAWETVDTRGTTQSDGTALLNITNNPSRFVNASTREVQARILHVSNAGLTSNRWNMAFDQIGFHFN